MASGDSDLNSIFWRYAKPEDNPRFMHMREPYIPQRRREERESWEASLQFMRAKNIQCVQKFPRKVMCPVSQLYVHGS